MEYRVYYNPTHELICNTLSESDLRATLQQVMNEGVPQEAITIYSIDWSKKNTITNQIQATSVKKKVSDFI